MDPLGFLPQAVCYATKGKPMESMVTETGHTCALMEVAIGQYQVRDFHGAGTLMTTREESTEARIH